MSRAKGLTIAEALTVLVLVAILTALLVPVLARAKRSAEIRTSLDKMRQIYAAIQIYRAEYDGTDGVYESNALLGLPTFEYWNTTGFGLSWDFWASPCGADRTIWETGLGGVNGYLTYMAEGWDPVYADTDPLPGNPAKGYLKTYRQNAVLVVDPYCNPPGTRISAPFITKRGLAVLLSGQLVNKIGQGNAGRLRWYSNPPDE